ncbi:hypothetical protein [Pedobacter sp. NJ-S-72]
MKIENTKEADVASENETDQMILTYILKHQQDKNLDSISSVLDKNKFWEIFPGKNVELLSWKVLIGLGHVITLRFLPGQLRAVNLAIEKGAWGAFHTEAYSTYDYVDIWRDKIKAVDFFFF